jgi:GABA permease
MAKTLIVANRTVGGRELAAAVRDRAVGDGRFLLLVPVAAPVSAAVAVGAAAADMTAAAFATVPDEHQLATERLEYGLEWLRSLGVEATGRLSTDNDTAVAVAAAVDADGIDEVIVSTLPTKISRWLRQDLPTRIERSVTVPVTVVTSSCQS